MKILKIKLGFYSLLAVLATSVFLISCEQEVVRDQANTLLNEEQLALAFEQDENVTRFDELVQEQLTTFIGKIKENDVDVEQIKALHITGDYEAVYTMLNIDVAEFENQSREIERLGAQIRNDYPNLMENCTSCGDNTPNIDAQYEALQKTINTELEMRCNWKYIPCMLACAAMPPGLRILCFNSCAALYC